MAKKDKTQTTGADVANVGTEAKEQAKDRVVREGNVTETIDPYGNKIRTTYHEESEVITVDLILLKHDIRKIGYIDINKRRFHAQRKRGLHLHYKSNSYGFNYKLLSETIRFDHVCLIDDLQAWKLPVEYILEHGEFLFFKEQGFEKQIFLKLELMAQFERKRGY